MKGIASRLRLPGALVVIVATVVLLGGPRVAGADGPLTYVRSYVPAPAYRLNDIILDTDPARPYAYVATDKGLTILDISSPQNPTFVKSVVTANCRVDCNKGPVARSQGLAKRRNAATGRHFVYLAAGAYGMQVIDVTDPTDPHTVASAIAPTRGTIYDVAVHPTADAAYVASYNGEVYVWDISDPTTLTAQQPKQTLGVMMWGGGVCTLCVQRMLAESDNGSAYVTGVSTATDGVRTIVAAVDWGYGGLYLWDAPPTGWPLTFLGTHRLKVSLYRAELDLANKRAHTLGAVTPNAGLIVLPISPIIDAQKPIIDAQKAATYCSEFGEGPVPSPASTAPNCSGGDTCKRCGYAKMQTATGLPLAGDGGGVGYSDNGKYAIYIGGRGTGELAVVDLTQPIVDPTEPGYNKDNKDPFGNLTGAKQKTWTTTVGTMGLQLAEAAGVVARNDVMYVAAGLLGVRVYTFPGLGSTPPLLGSTP